MNNRIIIIDGNSLINRAFYAMRNPMITREGIYTQGIFGFLNMLDKIKKDYPSGYIAITWDRKAPTFRHLEYDQYKAGRKKMPPELAMELPILKDIMDAMNIRQLEMDGWEADDLIGTIARKAETEGLEPLIITGDKDELQLATEETRVLITKKGISEFEIYDHDFFVEKYGFTPTQFIDFKGLMGDSSDNYPGVPGVGEKTATKLILEYGSVENLLANLDDMPKGKLKDKIVENKELAVLSRRLAEINTGAPIDIDFKEFEWTDPDFDKLVEIYTRLEFNMFLKRLDVPQKKQEEPVKELTGEIIYDTEKLSAVLGECTEIYLKVFGDNSHIRKPEVFGIGFAVDGSCYFISGDELIAEFVSTVNEKSIAFNGHDIKKDIYMLRYFGLEDVTVSYDTAVAEYVLEPAKSNYDIKTLAYEYLRTELSDEKDTKASDGQLDLFADYSKTYLSEAVKWLGAVMEMEGAQKSNLEENKLMEVLTDIELPLIPILASMEYEGVRCDADILNEIGTVIGKEVDSLTAEIYGLAGEEFNINSPMQLGTVLFEKMGLPASKKTKKGYSTSADILEKIKDKSPIIDLILQYRTLTKLSGTYVAGLLPLIGSDGRIHAHFQQTVTATGRLSCTEPNLQNIPVKNDFGRQIRKAFVSGEDHIFAGADYSQIELRVLAHMADDSELIGAFNEGKDIHRITAAKVLGIPEDEITPAQRSSAKAINFGVIYGMSGFGLSESLDISRKDAEKYINDYFRQYNSVKIFMDGQIAFAKDNGYVVTELGRKRYIHEITASNFMVRQAGERLAMNSPIQGTAADIIKLAMVKVYNALKEAGCESRLVLQIHDELIIETKEEELEKVCAILQENMESAYSMKVKLLAEVNTGNSWYVLK